MNIIFFIWQFYNFNNNVKTKNLLFATLSTLWISGLSAQTDYDVRGLYTDYRGFWKSELPTINTVRADSSHNMLAFKAPNGIIYSTGVDDAKLTANGISFIPQIYRGLPVMSTGTNLIIGAARNIPENTLSTTPFVYLIDGVNGLDLGTGLFNTRGTNIYTISNLQPQAIGDGIPDILIPQVGNLPNNPDVFKFTNANNQIVGNQIDILFNNDIPTLGNTFWHFYEPTNPLTPTTRAINGSRGIKMLAFDFADFGITTSNYTEITNFTHVLSGDSDQSFVAYNYTSLSILPIELSEFSIKRHNDNIELTWRTASEQNNDFFTIEKSKDGNNWEAIHSIKSAAINGNSVQLLTYRFVDTNPYTGQNYYRIKQTDFDGKSEYSEMRVVNFVEREQGIRLFPNPSNDIIQITGLNEVKSMQLINTQGQIIQQFEVSNNTFSQEVDMSTRPAGVYYLKVIKNNNGHILQSIIKQ